MKYLSLDSKIFIQNRARFIKKMKPNSIAIFPANPILPENSDAQYQLKQNSDVIWLSGTVQEKTMVVLYPDNFDKTKLSIVSFLVVLSIILLITQMVILQNFTTDG